MVNKLKEKVNNGGKALGIFHSMGSVAAVECFGYGGLDFFIIDCEHGPGDVESAMLAVIAAERHNITPLVRVREISRTAVLKMLDIGAMGLIVPFLNSIEDAKALVSYAKYAPIGQRGFAHARVSGFGFAKYASDIESQTKTANRESLLIPQCETVGCLNDIEAITALEGVDGIFVGPYDLSISLGAPGQFENELVKGSIRRVLEACKANNKLSFIFATNVDTAKMYFDMGFDCVGCQVDVSLLAGTVKGMVEQVKAII